MSEPLNSNHHLFTYLEIRTKLVQIFGKPKTDADHRKLHSEIRKCWVRMPQYLINHKLHKKIHQNDTIKLSLFNGGSLFTYSEIQDKLIQIFGEPKTDKDQKKLHEEIINCQNKMPQYSQLAKV